MITKRVLSFLFFSLFSIILFGQNLETVKNDKPIIENKGVLFYSLSDTCQPFTININASLSSHNIDNSFHINVCPGDTVRLTADANFSLNNPIYNQTLTNTKFIWQFADMNADTGIVVSRVFHENHGASLRIYAIDTLGCFSSNEVNLTIRVSANPIKNVNSPVIATTGEDKYVTIGYDTTDVIVLDSINLFAVLPPLNTFKSQDTMAIPDGSNLCYESNIQINSYNSSQHIQSENDITRIILNIEHTYLGDLSIRLICPNGATTVLKASSTNTPNSTGPYNLTCSTGGGTIQLGSADDSSNSPCVSLPGIGWNYEFRPGATNCFGINGPTINFTYLNSCGDTFSGVSLVPSVPNIYTATPTSPVFYGTYESLSKMIGCPLNGAWTIRICDHYAIDNGYLLDWGLQFSSFLLPSQEFYNVGIDSIVWFGNNITTIDQNHAFLNEPNPGVFTYGTKIYDEYGCEYDTTFLVYCFLQVEEITPNFMPIQFFPNPFSIDLKYIVIDQNWGNSDVNIYNISGQLVYKTHIGDQQNQFNLSSLASGNYILKVTNVYGAEYSVKIIVKK